ncbi:Transcription factor [Penicillium hetheringtonii]|uniref:Transcription factor n=1 Tax=Penicillium hetheringtonii TaxID=911720 RepID=A0AAD6GRS5_9EURO|nr:Transcription factor [Penicillium hetheringtonii]
MSPPVSQEKSWWQLFCTEADSFRRHRWSTPEQTPPSERRLFDLSPSQNPLFRRATRGDLRIFKTLHSLTVTLPDIVCKTCSDYKHVCLGYTESTAHLRSHSDSASRAPPISSLASGNEANQQNSRAVESCSPEPTHPPARYQKQEKSPQGSKDLDLKDGSSRDTSTRTKTEDSQLAGDSPESSRTSMSSNSRTHVPYFRYFGPTAIVPGFKQMVGRSRTHRRTQYLTDSKVVQVRGSRKSNPSMSSDSLSPLRSPRPLDTPARAAPPPADERDSRDANNIPFYDRDDTLPVPNLVTHLCELFFTHLGCSFPFLQRDRFLNDLNEKKVDTMLVDAVCSLAARFSPHPLLSPPQAPPIDHSQLPDADVNLRDRGLPFAQRASSALVDVLSCPTLSAVQACLLLAYEQFGSNHDSGLWMYLGISIRMAQDLGLQKHQGLKHNYGQKGVTPKEVMTGQAGKLREDQYDDFDVYQSPKGPPPASDSERAREREQVDSFWSIFFLDRVISSGTGDRRNRNYRTVTDLINGIQDVNHVTPDTLKQLAGMESDLTGIYQRLSPKLYFNAANFQAYVKAKEGTNFILLHFWFHTLIVLLHQPTLLNSFGGTIQHLYPNSRELSMSSAKTIADILSFSELVDGKSFIGNPFTSQPMYIAACAFLMESAYYSMPTSRSTSPPLPTALLANQSSGFVMPTMDSSHGPERKSTAKHILLASAARENYQRCYKALKALDAYWEGTRYILTVLDQKAKGIVDPLLYTAEDMENTTENTPNHSFTPGEWRGRADMDLASDIERTPGGGNIPSDGKWSPKFDPSQAIGWALTGATNSSQPNLSLLYQTPTAHHEHPVSKTTHPSQYSHSYPTLPVQANAAQGATSSFSAVAPPHTHPDPNPTALAPANPKYTAVPRTVSTGSPYFMSMTSPFPESSSGATAPAGYPSNLPSTQMENGPSPYDYAVSSATAEHQSHAHIGPRVDLHTPLNADSGGMMIESHDVDMNTLQQQESFPFSNGEILPWLEYLPQDVLSFFGENHSFPLMSPDDTTPHPHPPP